MKTKTRNSIWIVLTTLTILILFAGCTSPPPESGGQTDQTDEREEVRIGLVAPLTGPASTTGNDMWDAAEFAVQEINEQGGVNVNGKQMDLKLIKGDTETNPEQGVKAVTRLITQDEVDVLIGGFSSSITYADQVIASENKIPFIITGASSPVVTRRDDIDTSYFFHHCPTTDDYARDTLLFVNDVVRPKINERFNFSEDRKIRLGVLYQDGKYGQAVYEGCQKAIKEHDMKIEIVEAETFKRSETDYRSALTSLKQANVDVVYPAAFINEQTPIVVQGRKDVGLNSIYLSVECNDDPDYYSGVGRWGAYSIQESRFSPYTVPEGEIKDDVLDFREKFKKEYGAPPSMMGASTYEGVHIAVKAIENAGSLQKEKIKNSLNGIQMPEMVEAMENHTIKFSDDYRESKFQLYMAQLKWKPDLQETRPVIVWPDNLKEQDFVLPEWYEPGTQGA